MWGYVQFIIRVHAAITTTIITNTTKHFIKQNGNCQQQWRCVHEILGVAILQTYKHTDTSTFRFFLINNLI